MWRARGGGGRALAQTPAYARRCGRLHVPRARHSSPAVGRVPAAPPRPHYMNTFRIFYLFVFNIKLKVSQYLRINCILFSSVRLPARPLLSLLGYFILCEICGVVLEFLMYGTWFSKYY